MKNNSYICENKDFVDMDKHIKWGTVVCRKEYDQRIEDMEE